MRLGEEPAIVEREDGSLLMDGMLAIDEVKLARGFDSLPDEGSHHTLAAFILARLGRVPQEGEALAYGGWRFQVVDMDGPAHRQGCSCAVPRHGKKSSPAGALEPVSASAV